MSKVGWIPRKPWFQTNIIDSSDCVAHVSGSTCWPCSTTSSCHTWATYTLSSLHDLCPPGTTCCWAFIPSRCTRPLHERRKQWKPFSTLLSRSSSLINSHLQNGFLPVHPDYWQTDFKQSSACYVFIPSFFLSAWRPCLSVYAILFWWMFVVVSHLTHGHQLY